MDVIAGGFSRVSAAVTAAIDAWRSYGSMPELGFTTDPVFRAKRFAFLSSLYAGVGYQGEFGNAYRTAHDIYVSTRQVTNPVKALCDFYAVHVYSGPVSPDGEREVEGEDAALPLVTLLQNNIDAGNENEGNPPEGQQLDLQEKRLRQAFGQLSHGWWSWDTMLNHRVRQTEILGSLLTEIIDDPNVGKLSLEMIWPGLIQEIDLDASGNVKGYVLEYSVMEPGPRDPLTGKLSGGVSYVYRKVVNGKETREYKNDKLFNQYDNIYGFVPAVWDRARLGWSEWGEPAIYGSQAAMDEVNELWSHANDRMHQMFSSPIVIAGAGGTSDLTFPAAKRNQVNTVSLPGPGGMTTITFALGDVMASVDKINDAVALECPELRVYDRIREMSQVTGPGIRRAVADVEHRLNEQAALFDRQTIKLLQMGTAIAGMRANDGSWADAQKAPLTNEQKKFLPYSLDSFKAGDLDCMMLPRALVRESPAEKIAVLLQLSALSDPWMLEQAGVPQDEIDRMMAEKEANKAQMLDAFGPGPAGPNDNQNGPTGPTGTTGATGGTGSTPPQPAR